MPVIATRTYHTHAAVDATDVEGLVGVHIGAYIYTVDTYLERDWTVAVLSRVELHMRAHKRAWRSNARP